MPAVFAAVGHLAIAAAYPSNGGAPCGPWVDGERTAVTLRFPPAGLPPADGGIPGPAPLPAITNWSFMNKIHPPGALGI